MVFLTLLLRLFVDLDIGAAFVILPLHLICLTIVSDFFGEGFFLIAGFFELFGIIFAGRGGALVFEGGFLVA